MLAEGGTASPHVRHGLALSTSLGTWEAGLCFLSLSGDQEPTDHPPRRKRQQQPRGRQGLSSGNTSSGSWKCTPKPHGGIWVQVQLIFVGPPPPFPSHTPGREPTSFPLRKVFGLPV